MIHAASELPTGDSAARATPIPSTSDSTSYRRVKVDGVNIFYREAGPKDAPTIVLPHGFPSSSREFDSLIPLLAAHYHLVAPDFPEFGHSDAPSPSSYAYTFDNLANTINEALQKPHNDTYTLYLHDYGGPVGFRLMAAHLRRNWQLICKPAWRCERRCPCSMRCATGPTLKNMLAGLGNSSVPHAIIWSIIRLIPTPI